MAEGAGLVGEQPDPAGGGAGHPGPEAGTPPGGTGGAVAGARGGVRHLPGPPAAGLPPEARHRSAGPDRPRDRLERGGTCGRKKHRVSRQRASGPGARPFPGPPRHRGDRRGHRPAPEGRASRRRHPPGLRPILRHRPGDPGGGGR